jgi:hypothetical protein
MAVAPNPLLRLIPETVPTELRAIARWVGWKARPKPTGKLDKLPCSPHTGAVGDAHDPAAWGSFDEAVAAMRRYRLDGIGIVLTQEDSLVGVDLDGCIDDAGVIAPWAQEIITELDSYTERSPSGRGLRLFVFGGLPPGRRKVGDLELYDDARFLTVTGHHLSGTRATVEQRDRALRDLHARYFGSQGGRAATGHAALDAGGDDEPPVRLDAWGLAIWRGERPLRTSAGTVDRSRTLYALACVLARAGATAGTIAAALAERDRALGLDKYARRRDGGAAYRRMAARAAQECQAVAAGSPASLARLAAEQRRLQQELEQLRTQQRAVLMALQAMGARSVDQAGAGGEEGRR